MAGIGGTGIVTVNQVLAAAAVGDGLAVRGLDQTGLSQKAGPVTSHLRVARGTGALEPANRVGRAQAACYLAFDALTGADAKNLAYASAEHTLAVVSTSAVPTGAQVRDASIAPPDATMLLSRISRAAKDVVALDAAAAARSLFGDTMPANFLLVGAAYQAGALPMSAAAIEAAIELNAVAVADNRAAFRSGRVAVANPAAFAAATGSAHDTTPATAPPAGIELGEPTGETRRLVSVRAAQLIGYQGRSTADRYVADVLAVWRAERAVGDATAFSEAAARGLHKLTAYKDEYEVARLLTDPALEARLSAEVPSGAKYRYRLHPPVLRAMGRKKKIAFGPWMRPVLRAVAKGRIMRRLTCSATPPCAGWNESCATPTVPWCSASPPVSSRPRTARPRLPPRQLTSSEDTKTSSSPASSATGPGSQNSASAMPCHRLHRYANGVAQKGNCDDWHPGTDGPGRHAADGGTRASRSARTGAGTHRRVRPAPGRRQRGRNHR
jgi:indolepyruvate ferredoxin oxidoreductase